MFGYLASLHLHQPALAASSALEICLFNLRRLLLRLDKGRVLTNNPRKGRPCQPRLLLKKALKQWIKKAACAVAFARPQEGNAQLENLLSGTGLVCRTVLVWINFSPKAGASLLITQGSGMAQSWHRWVSAGNNALPKHLAAKPPHQCTSHALRLSHTHIHWHRYSCGGVIMCDMSTRGSEKKDAIKIRAQCVFRTVTVQHNGTIAAVFKDISGVWLVESVSSAYQVTVESHRQPSMLA